MLTNFEKGSLNTKICRACEQPIHGCFCSKSEKEMVRIFSKYSDSGSVEVPLKDLPENHCGNCGRIPNHSEKSMCKDCLDFNMHKSKIGKVIVIHGDLNER